MFFKKNNKIISGIFALIFIAITALFFASYREPANTLPNTEVINPIAKAEKQPDIVTDNKVILPPNKILTNSQSIQAAGNRSIQNQNQAVQEPADKIAANNFIGVTLASGENKYDISVEKGATVYDAMTKLASNTSFSFGAKYYSGLGYFIDSINGIKNGNGNYWAFYINGKYATVGVSSYQLSGGDNIKWRYSDKANY